MPRSRPFSSIEPLEARIAPALLINGANLLGGSSPASGESSAGGNSATVVKVLSGQAIVWYHDNHIVGISVGPNASLEVHGDIQGDIVANLTAAGRLSDSDNNPLDGEDGAVLLPNNIIGLKTFPLSGEKGAVNNIVTAGSVTNVSVQGALNGIYAGDGVFDPSSHLLVNGQVVSSLGGIDFNPVAAGTQTDFVFTKALAQTIDAAHKLTGIQAGAGVAKVSIGQAVELQIFAGSGNPNNLTTLKAVAGGSVKSIAIESAFTNSTGAVSAPSYEIHAGVGSSGLTGGAGGSIAGITEKTSTSKVIAIAGNGGNGSQGAGGAGGSISSFDAGSNSSLYTLISGNGGDGIPGGAGGNLTGNNFANRSPIGGLLVAGNFDNDTDGSQEVVVINQGTGEMVVLKNAAHDGSNFTQVVQHGTSSAPVTTISSVGNTPVAAYAAYVNNDDKLDIVVAYKDSNSLGVYFNQGGGVFWDSTLSDYSTLSVGLQFTPSKMVGTGSHITIAEAVADGTSALHLLTQTVDTSGVLTFKVENGSNPLSKPVADLVSLRDGSVLVGTTDGALRRATISSDSDGKPFEVTASLATIAGGLTDLNVDSAGKRVVALSTTGHAFYTFDFSSATSSGVLTPVAAVTGLTGKQLVANFISDGAANTDDQIAVLEDLTISSRVDVFTSATADSVVTYNLSKSVPETQTLKNFIPVYSKNLDAGFAAISGSLSQFTFSDGFVGGKDYDLPFASKRVEATAGNGGHGLDFQPVSGKLKSGQGGAGGSFVGFNAEANQMILTAGSGGDSVTNAGGAGGNIVNPNVKSTVDKTGKTVAGVQLFLHADELLQLTAGDGGSPSAPGAKTAAGGTAGGLGNLNIEIGTGDLVLTSGHGGDSRGGAAGAGGAISGITSLLHDGNLSVHAGDGGTALLGKVPATGTAVSGAGGDGGTILNFKHELRLEADVENLENPYSVIFTAGMGGGSVTGAGGNGGAASGFTLKLDEPNQTFDSGVLDANGDDVQPGAHIDSTLTTLITAGNAGSGAKGGNGGLISALKYDVVLDQKTETGGAVVGPAVLGLTAGNGGVGTNGAGGNGGSISLSTPISGLTAVDEDADPNLHGGPTKYLGLLVQAGQGANGSTKGGAGGDISGIVAQNEIFSTGEVITSTHLVAASLSAGHGGNGGLSDGGRGGSIGNTLVGVQGGFLDVVAGAGGNGGTTGDATTAKLAKGGAGGAVVSGEFGLVSSSTSVGMLIEAGNGGSGYAAGAVGGSLSGIKINSSQSTAGLSAILIAGKGGESKLAAGVGGKGGDVAKISQNKDVNSSINLIQAGNGGDNLLGKAGAGGSVASVATVGFIGRPSDGLNPLGVFDSIGNLPQGVFSGRGGTGASAALHGLNGSVSGISARQIAAIAAAVDSQGLFAAASKVTNVTADLIGFDQDRDGIFDNANSSTSNPGTVAAIDGFIFSETALVKVAGQRTGFVFIA